jgi:hypothetical protein
LKSANGKFHSSHPLISIFASHFNIILHMPYQ